MQDLFEWRSHMYSGPPDIIESPEFELYFVYFMDLIMARLDSALSRQTIEQRTERETLNELNSAHEVLQSAAPRLFLFLPSDLDQWDDSDPTIHTFRLYFLCDCKYESTEERYPTHVHISNHPGYDVDQPQEFIRQFGRLSLTILEAVKIGFSGKHCCIPTLNSCHILRSFDGNALQHQLTPESLGPLVDKCIAYIRERQGQDSDPSQQTDQYLRSKANIFTSCFQREQNQGLHPNESMTGSNARPFHSFLRLQYGDNGMGGLNRTLLNATARWLCPNHALIYFSDVEAVEKYVRCQGGSIDLQHSTIAMDLRSLSEVDTFAAARTYKICTFDLSLDFTWNPSRKELQAALKQVSESGASILELNGATLNTRQGSVEYSQDMFALHISIHSNGAEQLITLFNYPRPSESYVYFGGHVFILGFLFEGVVNRLSMDWIEVRANWEIFYTAVMSDDLELDAMWEELSRIVRPLFVQGLKGVDLFDSATNVLQCRLGVKDGAITGIMELHLPSDIYNPQMKKYPVLQRLVIRPGAESVFETLYTIAVKSSTLQVVDIPTQELHVFAMINLLRLIWDDTRMLKVTLSESDFEGRRAPLVKLNIGREFGVGKSPVETDVLEWRYDHVSEVLDDWGAHVLDLATQFSRVRLVSHTLNTSLLTERGLASMGKVLKQSDLQFLSVECGAFDPSLKNHLEQVLNAMQWSALKSLELAGDNIDAWIGLWAKHRSITKLAPFEVQLFRLIIVGSDGQEQQLSHTSAVWLHAVIYLFSPVEVLLKNIAMQEARDWELIRGATDDPLLGRIYSDGP